MPDPIRRPAHAASLRRRLMWPAMAAAALLASPLLIATAEPPVQPLPGAGPADACTIWFVGSSTIERWETLARDAAPFTARNRGIGGAEWPQLDARLAAEHGGGRPAAIVVYGGENDIAAGADAAEAFARLRRFLATKTRLLGGVPVIAVSLKPGPARWKDRPQQIVYDRQVAKLAAVRGDLSYVDIRPAMLSGGKPSPYYVADGIHMNPAGYAIWTAAVNPAIDRALPGRRAACARRATR